MDHVMSRGDQRENIFIHKVDRHGLSKTLAEACQKAEWQVQAYCLMSTHFRTGYAGASSISARFLGLYSKAVSATPSSGDMSRAFEW